ncbi:hypothetical protein QBC33DRAFT_216703 [Phialemonium atrogriseum]|uniref:AMP-dependent synthetase/ligase domain-containing protein n=1 Tax=Phialemonium atrogriseum TaxID=1093897 RepID=A0AAJ0C6B8_9PEZI|nr:uncharacterized protein QBC33DRAFT_216703 [Phialemonium atrogriseum]KAK1770785.1 hypothetical protein QBC33DRAFT_216703 [Phialemonium atrogriseum]
MASTVPSGRQYPGDVSLPFPDIENLSNSTTIVHDESITQPVKAFLPGRRKSLPITPRDLEEARVYHSYDSSTTLETSESSEGDDHWEKTRRSEPSIPDRNPPHGPSDAPLPAKKGNRFYRYLRWNFGSVYRRIFCLSVLGNIAPLAYLLAHGLLGGPRLTHQVASTAVSANILAAILARNEHVVNAMFIVFGTWPKRAPFWLRRLVAKVYSYGGVHSGCSVAATFWYIVFLVLLTQVFTSVGISVLRGYLLLVSYLIILLLVSIIIFAHPRLRSVIHNWFEGVHRFMGWTVVLLFWAQIMLLTVDAAASRSIPFGTVLITSPPFWMLLAITLLIIYPWTRLRLRDVEAEVLSDHCVKLNFNYGDVQYGQAVRLTDAPLRETHSFAVIPNPPAPSAAPHQQAGEAQLVCCRCRAVLDGTDNNEATTTMAEGSPLSTTQPKTQPRTPSPSPQQQVQASQPAFGSSHAGKAGFSVLVSNAGDWTKKVIHNPPKKMYTRGAPQYGVLRVAGLFSPCIVVATGSGIGPCLSLFVQRPDHPVRIVWSAPRPAATYGQAVVDLLYRADPGAVVIDTRKTGRPDLVDIAYRIWESSRREVARAGKGAPASGPCEAVVVISNQKVTRKVVYGLESRGVAAYGAIFDS